MTSVTGLFMHLKATQDTDDTGKALVKIQYPQLPSGCNAAHMTVCLYAVQTA